MLTHWIVVCVGLVSQTAFAAAPKWVIEKVDRSANGNRKTSLKVTSDGRVHTVYTGCSDAVCKNNELFYNVRGTDGKWTPTSVDATNNDTGWSASLEIDSSETMHVVYGSHFKYPTLQYAFKQPGKAWQKKQIGPFPGGYWTSTAIVGNQLLVSNTSFPKSNVNAPALQFASGPLGAFNWVFQILDDGQDAGWFTSLAIGRDGRPAISYTATSYPNGDLMLQRQKDDGTWSREKLDEDVVKSSLAIDSKGFYHLAYSRMDQTYMGKMDLAYATNSPDGEWKTQVIDGGQYELADAGYHPHLTIDSKDGLHITYSDSYHVRLMYARNVSGTWEVYPVTKNKSDGFYAWTEVDAHGGLHLTYDDGSQLMYGFCKDCAVH